MNNMENIKLSAYPLPLATRGDGQIKDASDWDGKNQGFTKLELGSLMMAQGLHNHPDFYGAHHMEIAIKATSLAKAVLEQANK